MSLNRRSSQSHELAPALQAAPTGNVVKPGQLVGATLTRACRYPFATLTGIGAAIVVHFAIAAVVPGSTHTLAATVIRLCAGMALYLSLSALMVLNAEKLLHLRWLFRVGALISLTVTVITAIPIAIGLALLPADWRLLPELQYLIAVWPISSIGLGVAIAGCSLPALLLAWPIAARTGHSIGKSVLLVWRQVEGHSYTPGRMSVFVGVAGWVLLTLPGAALLIPVLFAHLTAVLFKLLVVVSGDG